MHVYISTLPNMSFYPCYRLEVDTHPPPKIKKGKIDLFCVLRRIAIYSSHVTVEKKKGRKKDTKMEGGGILIAHIFFYLPR